MGGRTVLLGGEIREVRALRVASSRVRRVVRTRSRTLERLPRRLAFSLVASRRKNRRGESPGKWQAASPSAREIAITVYGRGRSPVDTRA